MSDEGSAVEEEKVISQQADTQQTAVEKQEEEAASEYSKADKTVDETMHVRVAAPFREYYDDQAFSISAVNLTGPFDILPKHHSFISLLTACDLAIRGLVDNQQKVIKISISGGVMHVKHNEVIVFLDV